MSILKANQWLNPDGTENYKCRAWVNFNGTGTPAIRASGNVSSITDIAAGLYDINLSTAMSDTNYVTAGHASDDGIQGAFTYQSGLHDAALSRSTTKFRMYIVTDAGIASDRTYVGLAIFR